MTLIRRSSKPSHRKWRSVHEPPTPSLPPCPAAFRKVCVPGDTDLPVLHGDSCHHCCPPAPAAFPLGRECLRYIHGNDSPNVSASAEHMSVSSKHHAVQTPSFCLNVAVPIHCCSFDCCMIVSAVQLKDLPRSQPKSSRNFLEDRRKMRFTPGMSVALFFKLGACVISSLLLRRPRTQMM